MTVDRPLPQNVSLGVCMGQRFFQRILIDNQFGVPRQSAHSLKLILSANTYHLLLISTTKLLSCI